jgi:hypothetical protein
MGRYYVESVINFAGWIEADSKEEAEEKGYYYDNLEYECVDSVTVGENELECSECGNDLDTEECECEEEEGEE